MPDLTPAQLAAVAGWIVAQAVAFGLLAPQYQQLAVSVGATVLAAAWHIADSHLRGHRALAVAQNPNLIHPPAEQAPAA